MKRAVIIVAGGQGLRMGGELPKQFLPLNGKPLLMHTLEAFYKWDNEVELLAVIPKQHAGYWSMLCREIGCAAPHRLVYGGASRIESVRNGLQATDCDGIIAVHDGVRPFVNSNVITNCFNAAESYGAAIPVVEMIDSVREIITHDSSRVFDRNKLRVVQTPQVFQAKILREAYQKELKESFTDDAAIVEAAGYSIKLVAGNCENIKITTPLDMMIAESLLKND
ncbi:MAG: 2-C-methyl-D-erythritol 4-phosphate cytidylyltransferase [Tannerella sp.]|jgi:2-C-methyl-D-erythritol 4-phosphate cytidylyltransferase|nr:2-C-methyl-D-erythritol 4-phosphate cytidylyltransferase [Tannerella sp.]